MRHALSLAVLLPLALLGCPDTSGEGEGEGPDGEGEAVGEGEADGEGEAAGEGEGEAAGGEGEGEGEPVGGEGEGEGEGEAAGGEGEGEGEGQPDVVGLDARPANAACVAPDRPAESGGIRLTRMFPALSLRAPLFLLERPGDSDRFYAIERSGRVVRWSKSDSAVTTPEVFCDLRDRVELQDETQNFNTEQGLLGIAFHPDVVGNGEMYLSYTAINDNADCDFANAAECVFESRLSRFSITDNGCDLASEVVLLDVDDFAANHNGGHIAFAPDGTLFWAMGDGGFANDPKRTGQDRGSLLGKMIRIDVDNADPGLAYAIPRDNPFRGVAGTRPEIYALGLRNPWRFSFDRATGQLWVGDVGQDELEEIDIVEAGGNYGWSVFEGTRCFGAQTACDAGGFLPPVVEYRHGSGRFSVTGGYVYRGTAIPDLVGTYLFADFLSKEIFTTTLNDDGSVGFAPRTTLGGTGVASFAEDAAGELYVLDLGGPIFRIDPTGPPAVDTFPRLLSETGCVDPADPETLASGVIPYGINHPFHSDGAAKERAVALPDGTSATVEADGDITLPIGSTLLKSFRVDDALIETRLFVRHDDGEWAGYTYEWQADGQDAVLVDAGGKSKVLGNGQVWTYPSRAGCMVCHTAAAGRTLGWEIGQLNGDFTYPQTSRTANQLATLGSIGYLDNAPADVARADVYPAVGDASVDAAARARTYLHVNCSMCHRPGGGGQSDADMRLSTSFAAANLCDEVPEAGDLGVAGARVIKPGDPASSLVSLRMKRLGAGRMPPLGSTVVDTAGGAVIDSFITGLTSCP